MSNYIHLSYTYKRVRANFKPNMRIITTFLLLAFCIQCVSAQYDTISNTSIKGSNEWEKLISETTLRGRYNPYGDNSFIKHFKIKTVEKLIIKTTAQKTVDTLKCYLIEYDTNGLEIVNKSKFSGSRYSYETYYYYDEKFNLTSSETQIYALIDGGQDIEILPNIEKRYFDLSHLVRKEFYFTDRKKSYKVFNYKYMDNSLLEKTSIIELKAKPQEIVFLYTFF
jgi:hypothetical protein